MWAGCPKSIRRCVWNSRVSRRGGAQSSPLVSVWKIRSAKLRTGASSLRKNWSGSESRRRDCCPTTSISIAGRRNWRSISLTGMRLRVELAAQEAKGRSELAAADESLRISRQEMQAASDRRSHIELNLVKKQAELKYLEETCNKQLGCTLQDVAEGDETVLDEVGLVEVEQKCQDLTSKIDALGPVNTEALEQYDEAQQRYDFLNAQRQDLLDSIRDTEKTISEIDVEARKRFTEAFELINANFREMFKTLFGGGIGEMRLSDAENAIESGIDIVASPPGKKLQSVLLLSGGERALTAMASADGDLQISAEPVLRARRGGCAIG